MSSAHITTVADKHMANTRYTQWYDNIGGESIWKVGGPEKQSS